MIRHKTFRGQEFNMTAFAEKNGDTRALSNVSMNARGDIIDKAGNVKVKSGQISKGLSKINDKRSKTVSLKDDEETAPVKQSQIEPDSTPQVAPKISATIVSEREVDTPEGPGIEVEYSDGSIEIIKK
jgi:hypothetical protein